jgi:hypothetical protein
MCPTAELAGNLLDGRRVTTLVECGERIYRVFEVADNVLSGSPAERGVSVIPDRGEPSTLFTQGKDGTVQATTRAAEGATPQAVSLGQPEVLAQVAEILKASRVSLVQEIGAGAPVSIADSGETLNRGAVVLHGVAS